MASPVTIRPAAPSDGDALAELARRSWSTLHAVTARPEQSAPFFDDTHHPSDVLVAEAAGEGGVVGYILVVPPMSLPANAHVRQIQGLVVDEQARGRGVARALLDAACAQAWKEGASRMTLRVLGHNVPARGLYTAAGFAEEGRLPDEFVLDGEYVDDILMGRSLTGRDVTP